jgi:hypothetical protein
MNPTFPALAEPYHQALHEAVDYILARFDPVGLLACGSIVRGTHGPTSDLDLYVLHEQPFRQRIQKFFNGVPAEIFVNPPHQVLAYLEEEGRAGRPITAHMLSTGFVVLERGPVVQDLRARATEALKQPPGLSAASLTFSRYMAAALFEDALDVIPHDPDTGWLIFARALPAMLDYHFLAANRPIPRLKDQLTVLAGWEPETAEQVRMLLHTPPGHAKVELARSLARHILQTEGFFEWETEPEVVGKNAQR